MNILDILTNLTKYYSRTRGVGHTHTMIKGLENADRDVLVVLLHQAVLRDFVEHNPNPHLQTACLGHLDDRMQSLRQPIAFDNTALWRIFEMAKYEICDVQAQNKLLLDELSRASDSIVDVLDNNACLHDQIYVVNQRREKLINDIDNHWTTRWANRLNRIGLRSLAKKVRVQQP